MAIQKVLTGAQMSKNKKRHYKPLTSIGTQEGWPSWFIHPMQSAEDEVLSWVFKNNERLEEVYFLVQMMQINYLVFRRNYEELVALKKEFDHPMNFGELALKTEKGKQITSDVVIEYTRLLHNFLASAKMLVEVTRRWIKQQFEGTEFWKKYQEEVSSRFANNVQAQFLEDLRDFTLRRILPLAMPELLMQQVSEHELRSSLGIILLKDHLLEWKKWSELGRMQILMSFEGEVDIQSIVEQYVENATEFTRWLFWQIREQFDNEIEQFNSVLIHMRKGKSNLTPDTSTHAP